MRTRNLKKKRFKKIKRLLYITFKSAIFTFIILLMIYNLTFIISSNFGKAIDIRFGKYLFLIVEDDTMSPSIRKNDVIAVKKVDKREISEGDVVVTAEENRKVARIVKDNSYEIRTAYILKGDNNYRNYSEEMSIETLEGKVIKVISNFGIIVKICRSWVITILILIWLIIKFNHYKIKIEDIKNEKEIGD